MPDIFCPLLEDGKPVVRPPKKGELFLAKYGVIRAPYDFNTPDGVPIYRRLSSDEYAVVSREHLDSMRDVCDCVSNDARASQRLREQASRALEAPFVQEQPC